MPVANPPREKNQKTPGQFRVRVRRGRLTLPKEVWEARGVPDEATFVVEPMEKGFYLVPAEELTPFVRAAMKFRRKVDEAGLTLEDLLEGLDEQGRRYTEEVYGRR